MSSVRQLKNDYPGGQQICDDPRLFLFDKFMSAEECAHLVELASPHLAPSLVSGGKDGVRSDGRTGDVHWISHGETEITRGLCERIAALVDIPLEKGDKWACNFWFRKDRFQTAPAKDPFRPSETTRRF